MVCKKTWIDLRVTMGRGEKKSTKNQICNFFIHPKNGLMVKMVTNQIPISCTVLVSLIFVAKLFWKSKYHERRKNPWKFVYILAKHFRSPFNLTNFSKFTFSFTVCNKNDNKTSPKSNALPWEEVFSGSWPKPDCC